MTLDDYLIEPKGWLLLALAHHSDGRWYCCLRHNDGRAAVAYAETAQLAYYEAYQKADEMMNG